MFLGNRGPQEDKDQTLINDQSINPSFHLFHLCAFKFPLMSQESSFENSNPALLCQTERNKERRESRVKRFS